MPRKNAKLRALAESAQKNRKLYTYDGPKPSLLEVFNTPPGVQRTDGEADLSILITVPEFTSLCPLTGQPDFATIEIEYTPDSYCVESKSLKLYMLTYRQHGAFHEECVQTMLKHLVDVLSPKFIRITGKFTPRGGIPFWPTATYTKKPRL
jgi:7-cyano-7-deazaguanine reductase